MASSTSSGTHALFPLLDQATPQAPDPLALSLQIGLMVTGAVSAAVKLHLAERLEEGPKTITILAQETETHEPSLALLMRALAGIGLFEEIDAATHTFGHTHRSRLLLPSAMADLVLLWGADYQWNSWRDLVYTIQTGQPAMRKAGNYATIWAYLQDHPKEHEIFQRGLTANARLLLPALDGYPFSEIRHLVDVGGGHGMLAVHLLQHYPLLKATLFDQADVIEQVQLGGGCELPEAVRSRYTLVAGDFFEALPEGADCYLFKNVLMDWSDEAYVRILCTCHRAMNPSGRVLVIEPVLGDTPFTNFFSLQMAMMMHAARHRTVEEHQAHFERAGFTLIRVIPLGLGYQLLEGRVAQAKGEGE
jgi:hypothetical protein